MAVLTNWLRKAWLVLLVAGVVIVLDQWTKSLVRANIPDYATSTPIPALYPYFYFEHVHNYGAAFGILQGLGGPLIVIAVIVTIAMLVYIPYLPADQWVVRVLLGLQLGGAVGNVLDRINQGYVTDFIKTGIPGFYYIPNYNIADSAIVVGVTGLAIYIVWTDVQKQREDKQKEAKQQQEANAEAPPSNG